MPTFAFPERPPRLTPRLQPRWNAPLPVSPPRSFGSVFDARLLSMQRRSTSELLRTL